MPEPDFQTALRWQGGESPARVAVAVNPTPFMMQHPQAPEVEYTKKVRKLMVALSGRVDVDGLVLGSRVALSPENLRRYSLVVIPQDMGLGLSEAMAVENPEVPTLVPDRASLKVGVYHAGMGAAALLEALSRHDDLNAFPLSRLDREALGKCQVVMVPQPASRVFFNRSRGLLRGWVDGGGRILLFHDAVGFKNLTAVFPEIGEGSIAPKTHEARVVKDHPITAGLAVGQTVRHAYADHIGMRVGPQGEALLTDTEGLAAMVVGSFGKGRVVLQGMIAGYASVAPGDYKGREAAPEGDELRLLLQAVRWLGGPEE